MSAADKDPLTIYIDKNRLLSTKDIMTLVGKSRSTIERWVKDGSFPQPKKQHKTNLWLVGDYQHWVEQKIAKGG